MCGGGGGEVEVDTADGGVTLGKGGYGPITMNGKK
jgi:hypothetical protein